MGLALGRCAAVLGALCLSAPAWAGLPPPPECSGPSGTIIVNVGDTYTVTLTGTDPDDQDLEVDDTGSLPPGATITPPDATVSPSPFDVEFEWTPTLADAGNTYLILINFINVFDVPGGCEFEIEVPLPPTTTFPITTTTEPATTTTTPATTTTNPVTTTTVPVTITMGTTTSSTSTTTTAGVTTTTLAPVCGNGILEGNEQCDPPSDEICNNGDDDDGDMLIDCLDTDCQPGADPNCDDDCMLVELCEPVLEDPARIRFDAGPAGLDAFSIHGRFRLHGTVDPIAEGFDVMLSNANGSIYRGVLEAGVLVKAHGRYFFRSGEVRRSEAGGIYAAGVRVRKFGGVSYLVFRVRAHGDFATATMPRMSTQVIVGNNVGELSADWRRRNDGWQLNARDYTPEP